ncbi:hypothetical protein V2J09_016239 [Rumex salicifolius]
MWVLRFQVEAYTSNPQEKILDTKTISDFFIGLKFYHPNHSIRIEEISNVGFIENDKASESEEVREVIISEIRAPIPISLVRQIVWNKMSLIMHVIMVMLSFYQV